MTLSWREKAEALERALDKADEALAYALQIVQWGEAEPSLRVRASNIRKGLLSEIDKIERLAEGARRIKASY